MFLKAVINFDKLIFIKLSSFIKLSVTHKKKKFKPQFLILRVLLRTLTQLILTLTLTITTPERRLC